MMSFQLSIVTPGGNIFNETVESVFAPGEMGRLGVLTGHAPLVVALKMGVLKVTRKEQEIYFGIAPGILEVNHRHDVLVLADNAVEATNYEEAERSLKK